MEVGRRGRGESNRRTLLRLENRRVRRGTEQDGVVPVVHGLFVPWTLRTLHSSCRGLFVSSQTDRTVDDSYIKLFVPPLDDSQRDTAGRRRTCGSRSTRTLYYSYHESFVLVLFVSWTIRTVDCSYPLDYSYYGPFVPSLGYSYSAQFVPWTFRTMDDSYINLFVPPLDDSQRYGAGRRRTCHPSANRFRVRDESPPPLSDVDSCPPGRP